MESTPLGTIVVGVDGSAASGAALAWAVERVPEGGSVQLVHAVSQDAEPATPDWLFDTALRDVAPRSGAEIERHLEAGDPDELLLEIARSCDADVVVVGAHGAGGARGRSPFLGSVTRSLLHRSEMPLIVHHGTELTGDGPVIGCVGYGPPAAKAASWAASYAASRRRPLELLHAVSHRPMFPLDSPIDMLGSYLGTDVDIEWAQEDLESTAAELRARYPAVRISATTARGSAVRAILDAAAGSAQDERAVAEIVVVGRALGPALCRRSVSPRLHQLIARAKWPTAVVPCVTQI